MLSDNPLQPPSDEQVARIYADVGESEGKMANYVKIIESWLAMQSYFPRDYDHHIIEVYLRSTKMDIERTKKYIVMFFVAMNKIPGMLNFDYSDYERQVIDNLNFVVLPKLSEDGCRILWLSVHKYEPHLVDIAQFLRVIFTHTAFRMFNEHPFAGDLIFLNAIGCTLEFASKFLHPSLPKYVKIGHSFSIDRIKKVAFITDSKLIHGTINLFKKAFPEKIQKRFEICDAASVTTTFPPEYLPEEFGGCAGGDLYQLAQFWRDYFAKHRAWFDGIKQWQIKDYVPKDFTEDVNLDDVYGVQGHFRQINID